MVHPRIRESTFAVTKLGQVLVRHGDELRPTGYTRLDELDEPRADARAQVDGAPAKASS